MYHDHSHLRTTIRGRRHHYHYRTIQREGNLKSFLFNSFLHRARCFEDAAAAVRFNADLEQQRVDHGREEAARPERRELEPEQALAALCVEGLDGLQDRAQPRTELLPTSASEAE